MAALYICNVPLPRSRPHQSNDDCLNNKRDDYQNCAVLCMTVVHSDTHTHEQFLKLTVGLVFGRPFVKRFALCYRSVVCPVCPVCDVRALWPNGWTDQDETWLAGTPRPWPHCVRWGPSSPSPKGAQLPLNSVAAKWLHGLRCHLVWS